MKTAVLAVGAAAVLVRALFAGSTPAPRVAQGLAVLWLGTLAFSALVGVAARPGGMWRDAAAGLVLLGLLHAPPEPRSTLRAIAGAGSVLALVAGLQGLGADPFHWLGWSSSHPGERMRIYGTLGNPDFVAAYLGASLCVTLGEAASAARERSRGGWLAAAVLQLCALAAARSWGSLAALGAAGLSLLWTRVPGPRAQPLDSTRRLRWAVALGVAIAGALLLFTVWGRSPGTVLEGRLYLWRVAAPRVLDAPVFGHGPGSFEVLWPTWEAEYWARGAPAAQQGFVALQDHAHCDYLEWLLELGLVGAVPRFLLLLCSLWAGRQASDARGRATVAALVALSARALLDFPLARPAELCLFVVLLALVWGRGAGAPEERAVRPPGLTRTG